MNLYDTNTYPPSPPPPTITTTVPPSHTASTGAPADIGWMVPAAIVLVLIGAVALRLATKRKAS